MGTSFRDTAHSISRRLTCYRKDSQSNNDQYQQGNSEVNESWLFNQSKEITTNSSHVHSAPRISHQHKQYDINSTLVKDKRHTTSSAETVSPVILEIDSTNIICACCTLTV